ncbi:uncharacterized protein [Manis javanica]|uniref:uncharacterized protein n=1 Tax=Manis javanica TaxID=9974 RepID=UPI003C6D4A39
MKARDSGKQRDSLPARCGRWLRDHRQRLCPCCPRNPEHEEEPTLCENKVRRRRAPWTVVMKKWRMRTARVETARNISWSTPESSLPPEDTDQSTTGQQATRPSPSPGLGRARRHACEPDDVTSVLHGSQLSCIPEDQALHRLVQEEPLGPTVAEQEERRQMQLAPGTQGGPAPWLEPVQELPENPVLELRPVSPASAPAEPEDIPAVESAPVARP